MGDTNNEVEQMVTSENVFNQNLFSDLLPVYYKRLFPFSLYYKWLRYEDDKQFTHREFSFTLKDDIYIRYQSFSDEEDMKKEVIQKCPHKIDIGAVYSFRPCEQRTVSSFHPLEKELVFDIDMTDYDEVRTCCSGAEICMKCWPLMTIAMKIIDRALREDFGFKHMLWVYSGRRGVHCWVCDKVARQLTPEARSAIVEYLSLVKGGEFKSKKVHLPEILHPSIQEASKIIEHYFEDLMIHKQGMLDSKEAIEKMASLCLDPMAKEIIPKELSKYDHSKEKWQRLREIEDIVLDQKNIKNRHFILEVMFQFCYPRLDVNVSKGLNHLLKAPFCVHPKTGKICVPIDIKNADIFDPMSVPTINTVCEEIDVYEANLKSEPTEKSETDMSPATKIEESSKTSLHKSIKIFQAFVNRLLHSSKKVSV